MIAAAQLCKVEVTKLTLLHITLPNFHFFNYAHRGLAHSGEEGVYNVVKLLNDELALAMKLMGAITIAVSECARAAIHTLTCSVTRTVISAIFLFIFPFILCLYFAIR
jgi:hypothetical protein